MKKRPKLHPLDINRCPRGYYWVRPRTSGKPEIMELRYGGQWWHMAWDIPQRDMTSYEVLGPVAPYTGVPPLPDIIGCEHCRDGGYRDAEGVCPKCDAQWFE